MLKLYYLRPKGCSLEYNSTDAQNITDVFMYTDMYMNPHAFINRHGTHTETVTVTHYVPTLVIY